MPVGPRDTPKLYQQIARAIAGAIDNGRYSPGDKLPSERELADEFSVSRPTVRDAMIALEFQGLVEARQGSGVYVKTAPRMVEDSAEQEISALELVEARRLFEGEACALAAAIVTDEQLALLDQLVAQMEAQSVPAARESLELEFHLAIARATGNAAITATVEDLWAIRQHSALCTAALTRARVASRHDSVAEHQKIAAALRTRDPKTARAAMHACLGQVIEDLLALAEADAVEQTRKKIAEQRRLLGRRTEI